MLIFMSPNDPSSMEVDTEEGSNVAKWAAGFVVALGALGFILVAFWSLLSLFWLLPLVIPAAYLYFRKSPAQPSPRPDDEPAKLEEADAHDEALLAEEEEEEEAFRASDSSATMMDMDEPDEVTAKVALNREDLLTSQIKAAADAHDWDLVAELAGEARARLVPRSEPESAPQSAPHSAS